MSCWGPQDSKLSSSCKLISLQVKSSSMFTCCVALNRAVRMWDITKQLQAITLRINSTWLVLFSFIYFFKYDKFYEQRANRQSTEKDSDQTLIEQRIWYEGMVFLPLVNMQYEFCDLVCKQSNPKFGGLKLAGS